MSLLDLDIPSRRAQAEAWAELVEWVAWLRETFSSVGNMLTDCWPRHPDLVLDLLALREWRNWVYSPPQAEGAKSSERRSRGELADIWRDHLEQAMDRWRLSLAGCRGSECSRSKPSERLAANQARASEIAESMIPELGCLASPEARREGVADG